MPTAANPCAALRRTKHGGYAFNLTPQPYHQYCDAAEKPLLSARKVRDPRFRTGDIARFDADGFLWLVDRKKDMFISGGENVYPAEIEAALAAYPNLKECAVVGVPDERWGEVGHLVLVPTPDADLELAAVLAYLEPRLARYKIPKHVSVMDALPRNGAGKILKGSLRVQIRTATLRWRS